MQKPSRIKRMFPLKEKVPRLLRMIAKESGHWCRPAEGEEQRIVFIVGCQRLGTTLFTHIFERDVHAKVYGEWSALSSMDKREGLRLNPLEDVRARIERSRFPLVVTKPLVESQNIVHLLEAFPNSRALWLFRDFHDVSSSNLVEFGAGNGLNDLTPIVEGVEDDWRSERVSSATREQILRFYHPGLAPHDAAALFWFARNQLFFELGLDSHPHVLAVRYEEFVAAPKEWMRTIYAFLDRPYPGDHIVASVSTGSVGKGRQVPVSDDVRELCASIQSRLIQAAGST